MNFYAILQPEELIEGMKDDEALVFKVSRLENGEEKFEIELDDEIIDAVFSIYHKLLDNQPNSDIKSRSGKLSQHSRIGYCLSSREATTTYSTY